MDSIVTPARVVVVEDDARMARALERYLRRDGHLVTRVASGPVLRQLCRENDIDLVLLDLNLGSEDGMDLARELLRSTSAAVIIVTGRVDLQDRITGLDAGADDYVTKPFDPEELLARVRAVLRRHSLSPPPRAWARVGPYMLERDDMTLSREDGQVARVRFTETQTRILLQLMQNPGRTVTRDALCSREVKPSEDRSVDVHVANIRRKLRESGIDDLAILPVRGAGYRIHLTGASAAASS
ncbi:response regulator transcription factor [Thioalkalivibrio sp.]|uniref:response regulator transcription factor n=1 Tax=Thioalkalivibrio sp. TaxID=2093813 RepID=UPI0035614984